MFNLPDDLAIELAAARNEFRVERFFLVLCTLLVLCALGESTTSVVLCTFFSFSVPIGTLGNSSLVLCRSVLVSLVLCVVGLLAEFRRTIIASVAAQYL